MAKQSNIASQFYLLILLVTLCTLSQIVVSQVCNPIISTAYFDGDFETGDLTTSGWTYTDLTFPLLELGEYPNGTSIYFSNFFNVTPTSGNMAAATGWDGFLPGVGLMTLQVDLTFDDSLPSVYMTFNYRTAYDLTLANDDKIFSLSVTSLPSITLYTQLAGEAIDDSGPLSYGLDITSAVVATGGPITIRFSWTLTESYPDLRYSN